MVKVSVVVPIYNVEKYIGQLIESIQKQTLKEIEIILVDDGSPDQSGAICDKYAASDSRIQVLHKPNGGVSAARNDGMSLAHGEYIIFCDSDDWLPENALQALYEEGTRTNADIIIGDVYQNQGDKETLARFYKESFVTEDKEFIEKMIQADFYKTYCPLPPESGPAFGYGGPWNKLVKKHLLDVNKIKFDVRVKGIFDDILYTAHILANAKKVAYITVPVYNYRIIPVSITRTYKKNALEINRAIFNSWEEFINKYDPKGIYIKPYYATVIRRFVEVLPVYFLSEKNPNSLSDRLREAGELLKEEPYQTAIKNVDPSKLSSFQRQIHRLMAWDSPILIFAVFKAKSILKNLLG